MTQREKPACPKYARDDEVQYTDHFGRVVRGRVKRVDATWHGYDKDRRSAPTIGYTLTHPTYRNREMHLHEDKIISLVS